MSGSEQSLADDRVLAAIRRSSGSASEARQGRGRSSHGVHRDEQRLRNDQTPGRVELRRLHPRDAGQRQLGHFAPFSRRVGERLWPLPWGELEAAVPALR